MPRRSAPPGGVDHAHDLDDVALDAEPSPSGGSSSAGSGSSRRLVRSPWRLPVAVAAAVAAAVAVLGAAGVHSARTSAGDDLALSEQLAALQVGTTQVVEDVSGGPRYDGDGRLLLGVQSPVLDSGDRTVSLTALGTSTAQAELTSPASLPDLAAGASRLLELELAVDCSAVPTRAEAATVLRDAASVPTTSRTQWLDLRVEVGGEQVTRRYLTADTASSTLDGLLPFVCDPAVNGAVSAQTSVDEDGHLVVDVTNGGPDPATVAVEGAPALGVVSDVPLPATVAPGRGTRLVLSVRPDCAAIAAEPAGEVLALPMRVVQGGMEDGGGSVLGDPALSAAWTAQQVTRACD